MHSSEARQGSGQEHLSSKWGFLQAGHQPGQPLHKWGNGVNKQAGLIPERHIWEEVILA